MRNVSVKEIPGPARWALQCSRDRLVSDLQARQVDHVRDGEPLGSARAGACVPELALYLTRVHQTFHDEINVLKLMLDGTRVYCVSASRRAKKWLNVVTGLRQEQNRRE